MTDTPLLDTVNTPDELRHLALGQLPQLCRELRACLLQTVSQTGGHLASGLGVVELTVAIHYVFDTPHDSLVWDVGHQAYPHKILTGRRAQMPTLKRQHGLSGFPKRDESRYDDFGVGHSSTSISAALGMAIADQLNGKRHSHIAVIGDGAMTAGMAFEALHHAASLSADLLVILNDNDMSISPNVGAMSSYLSEVLGSELYQDVRQKGKAVLKHIPPLDGLAKFVEERAKDIASANNLFEDLGFDYTGPQDGHDVLALVATLKRLKTQSGPKLLHVKTVKGKGYCRAEAAPIDYHGVSGFDVNKGLVPSQPSNAPTFTQVFSAWINHQAQQDSRLVAITPAMREGSGLVEFSQQFPNRYYDVAIAEQHAVTLAAGMACKGLKPVVAIYSTFLQRAYDQLIHDVALQNLDVLFALDRAGVVGEDGATHAGVFDIAYSCLIPNLVVMTPSDELEMLALLQTGYAYNGPALVRYPKGKGDLQQLPQTPQAEIAVGQSKLVRQSSLAPSQVKKLAILVFGTLLARCHTIAATLDATLIDMRFAKPFDQARIEQLIATLGHTHVVILEEGSLIGGVGAEIADFVHQCNAATRVKRLGIADEFVPHGKRDEVLAGFGLDETHIAQQIQDFFFN